MRLDSWKDGKKIKINVTLLMRMNMKIVNIDDNLGVWGGHRSREREGYRISAYD